MRRLSSLFSVVLCTIVLFSCNKEEPLSDLDDLRTLIANYKDMCISRNIIPARSRIQTAWGTIITTPEYDSKIIWLDPLGYMDQDHLCTYVFLNTETMMWKSIESMGCIPLGYEGQPFDYNFNEALPSYLTGPSLGAETKSVKTHGPRPSTTPAESAQNVYSIVLNSGGSPISNLHCYVEDCKDIYGFLKHDCGVSENHIYVLMGDGTHPDSDCYDGAGSFSNTNPDLDDDGNNDILFAATPINLTSVFSAINDVASQGDVLFLYITGPASASENVSNLLFWNNVTISKYTLASYLSQIKQKMIINILIQSSHSGYFSSSSLVGQQGTVTTSCSLGETIHYDNLNSAHAFTLAWINDQRSHYHRSIKSSYLNSSLNTSYIGNSPSYLSVPDNYGTQHTLYGTSIPNPILSGASDLPDNTTYTYHLTNVQEDMHTQWSVGEGLRIVSSSNEHVTVNASITQPYLLNSRICASVPGWSISPVSVNIWKNGTIFSTDFLTISGSPSCGTISLPPSYEFNTYFLWEIGNCQPLFQGYPFTDYEGNETDTQITAAVSFMTPLQEQLRIIQTFTF